MSRWPGALLLAALLIPGAAAFATTPAELLIAYRTSASPVVLAAGDLHAEGVLGGGLLLRGANDTAFGPVPQLLVLERDGRTSRHAGATIEIEAGGIAWPFTNGTFAFEASAPYALGLALPESPVPRADGQPQQGFALAGELRGAGSWSGGATELVPLDAVVTIRDAAGQPLPTWDARRVNRGVANGFDTSEREVFFRVEGAFPARLGATLVSGAVGSASDATIRVSRAEEDRFAETVEVLEQATGGLTRPPDGDPSVQSPLEVLGRISGILNGALLVTSGPGTGPEPVPTIARWGDEEFAVGAVNILRGDDLALAWRQGEMRVEGEPTVALGRDGFAIEEPARIGIFPVVSLLLWAAAAGAVVLFFVKRPPKAKSVLPLRLLSIGVFVLLLLLALYLWDRSFLDTFGTSALELVRQEGISPRTIPQIGVLAALELVPWSIAALLFALPVRIALGVGLRYLGKGPSYKGLASAGGLVALAVLGPLYALWCFNLVWDRLTALLPSPS